MRGGLWLVCALATAGCGLENPYRNRDPKDKVLIEKPSTQENGYGNQPRESAQISTSLTEWETQYAGVAGTDWPAPDQNGNVSGTFAEILANGPFRPDVSYSATAELSQIGDVFSAHTKIAGKTTLNPGETCLMQAFAAPLQTSAGITMGTIDFGRCLNMNSPESEAQPDRLTFTDYQSVIHMAVQPPAPQPRTVADFAGFFSFAPSETPLPLHVLKPAVSAGVIFENNQPAAKYVKWQVFSLGESAVTPFRAHAMPGSLTLNGSAQFLDVEAVKGLKNGAQAQVLKTKITYAFDDFTVGNLANGGLVFGPEVTFSGSYVVRVNQLSFRATGRGEPCTLDLIQIVGTSRSTPETYTLDLCNRTIQGQISP